MSIADSHNNGGIRRRERFFQFVTDEKKSAGNINLSTVEILGNRHRGRLPLSCQAAARFLIGESH